LSSWQKNDPPVRLEHSFRAQPQGDISIEFTGLRPGEKLYEELLIGDNVAATPHPMIMTANEDHLPGMYSRAPARIARRSRKG
jgi:FlaA1/EpsC-like NDP-sugar epimerase